jgi:hypothetical protein
MKFEGQWTLPHKVATKLEEKNFGELYCFVLDPPLSAIVNGVECATWGHGL